MPFVASGAAAGAAAASGRLSSQAVAAMAAIYCLVIWLALDFVKPWARGAIAGTTVAAMVTFFVGLGRNTR